MDYQEPSLGIMTMMKSDRGNIYRVSCSCGEPDHDMTFHLETVDDEIEMHTYVNVNTDHWSNWLMLDLYKLVDNYVLYSALYSMVTTINTIVRNTKLTWNIWSKGSIKFESTIIMKKEQALQYAETIKHAFGEE
jgi:hypothetical protein